LTDIRQELLDAKEEQRRAQEQLSQARARTQTQQYIRQLRGRVGVAQKQKVGAQLGQVEQQLTERGQYLSQIEQQLNVVEGRSEKDAYKIAKRLSRANIVAGQVKDPQVKYYLREIRQGREDAVQAIVAQVEEQRGQSLLPKIREQITEQARLAVKGDISLKQLNARINTSLESPSNLSLDPRQLRSVDTNIVLEKLQGRRTIPIAPPRVVSLGEPPLRERLTFNRRGSGSIIQDIDTLSSYAGEKSYAF